MIKKYCPRCQKFSYSASASGEWICPTCGLDLRKKPALNLGQMDLDDGCRATRLTLIQGGLASKQ